LPSVLQAATGRSASSGSFCRMRSVAAAASAAQEASRLLITKPRRHTDPRVRIRFVVSSCPARSQVTVPRPRTSFPRHGGVSGARWTPIAGHSRHDAPAASGGESGMRSVSGRRAPVPPVSGELKPPRGDEVRHRAVDTSAAPATPGERNASRKPRARPRGVLRRQGSVGRRQAEIT